MGKIKITIEDLFNLNGSVIYNPDSYKPLSVVEIDTRKINKPCLFVAIKGEKYDGHNFIQDAIDKGAKALIINRNKLEKFSSLNIPFITVPDTIKAYGELANRWRHKLNAKVVSITGSNGKTTTKEMIATLLEEKFNVVKSEANNNNHIGVPLTIFSADENCEMLILEQGTNHLGEIPYSAKISEPDYAIITNIGDSHLEFLKSREKVFKEKSALFDEAEKRGGIIFINVDDPIINKNKKRYKNIVTYGFKHDAEVKGKILNYDDLGRATIFIQYHERSFDLVLPLSGESNAKNFLAAAAVALKIGLNEDEIINASKKIKPVHGRLEIKEYPKAILVDDTYNASPASVEAAYKFLKKVKRYKNKIMVLGDIFELGKSAPKFHKELANIFSEDKNITVLTIGNLMKYLHRELKKIKIKTIHFDTRDALSLYLKYEDIDNSVILVKGSRGMKMEEFINILEQRFE
ncbi:UDP-N-acetylmuramoyl-tripeptide--D-alanyl-D-alanine ligase [Ignavibacteria bacterium 4148-Me]|uniref:UDP-N-acetylmuramoyl-tripeptide--D-alanyl-D- alanine ligase n=1 Tax=Rosettibacter primus TaxID=3111523 RepID=UPI00336C16E4